MNLMPNGQIGEPGVGFSKGFWPKVLAFTLGTWIVLAIATFTAIRFIHWIVRG